MNDEHPPLVYRLIKEMYEASEERGSQNVGLDLCNAENFTFSVGPNPGGEPHDFCISVTYCGPDKLYQQVYFTPDDDLPARQLAQALTAWADWIDKQRSALPALSGEDKQARG